MSTQATNPQADHVGHRAGRGRPGGLGRGRLADSQGGTPGDRPPRRRTQAVDSPGLGAPADAAAPAAQQHVRTLGPGRAGHPYDERLLSNTRLSCMYTPGAGPVTFEVDGLRLGCAMGIEAHFPELFAEYRSQAGAAHWLHADHHPGAARLGTSRCPRRTCRCPGRSRKRPGCRRQGDRGGTGRSGQRIRRPAQCRHAGVRGIKPHQDCRYRRRRPAHPRGPARQAGPRLSRPRERV
jgi:hypothetical protein